MKPITGYCGVCEWEKNPDEGSGPPCKRCGLRWRSLVFLLNLSRRALRRPQHRYYRVETAEGIVEPRMFYPE